MRKLHDIMTDFEVMPSQDCWQKLSHRLDMAMPQASASTEVAPKATSAPHAAGSTLLKVAVATLSAAAVTTGITIAVVNSHKTIDTPNEHPISQTIQDSTVNNENEQVDISEQPTIAFDKAVAIPSTHADTTSQKGIVSEIEHKTTSVSNFTATTTPQATTKPMALHVKPQNLKPLGHIALPSTTPIATAAQNDPAVQQMGKGHLDFQEPVKLEIPNVFTPNGDGVNDYFTIKGLDQCNIRQLSVHNRGGHIVFNSNNYENNWNGDNCPDGVYYYQLTIDNHGIQQTMTGSVTIIRK